MKNLFFLFFILVSVYSYSQDRRFNSGLLLGFNASQISGDQLGGYHKLGLFTGVSANYPIGKKTTLGMAILFTQKGSRERLSINANSGFSNYKLDLNYIEVPFMINTSFAEKYMVEGGLSLGTLINAKERDITGSTNDPRQFKPLELALQIGASRKLTDQLTATLRSTNSILPVRLQNITTNVYKNWWNRGQYTSVLSIFLTYSFLKP